MQEEAQSFRLLHWMTVIIHQYNLAYKQYLYLFEDESIKGMKLMIEEVLSFKSDDLKSKGYTARDFILKNKNANVQIKKILQLIKN